MEEAMGMRESICLSIQINPNRAQDVLVDRGQRLVQQPLYVGDLRTHRLYLALHLPLVNG
jgi:hypothetical protein